MHVHRHPEGHCEAAIGAIPLAMGSPNGDVMLAVAVLPILLTAPLGALIIDKTHRRLLTRESVDAQ